MKAKDVCRLFNIHRQCLSRWVKKGKVQVKLMPNGRYDYIITQEQELSKIDPRFKEHFYSYMLKSKNRNSVIGFFTRILLTQNHRKFLDLIHGNLL